MQLPNCLLLAVLTTTLQSHLKIISTPDGTGGPAPCALTCSGVARHNETWQHWNTGHVYRRVDMSGCQFVSEPVVMVTVRGYLECPGAVKVWNCQRKWNHVVYLLTDDATTPEVMSKRKCDVYWTATGFQC